MTIPELLVEIDLRAIVAERAAHKNPGSPSEHLAACFRSSAKALRDAAEIERKALLAPVVKESAGGP